MNTTKNTLKRWKKRFIECQGSHDFLQKESRVKGTCHPSSCSIKNVDVCEDDGKHTNKSGNVKTKVSQICFVIVLVLLLDRRRESLEKSNVFSLILIVLFTSLLTLLIVNHEGFFLLFHLYFLDFDMIKVSNVTVIQSTQTALIRRDSTGFVYIVVTSNVTKLFGPYTNFIITDHDFFTHEQVYRGDEKCMLQSSGGVRYFISV